ncbi:hypothetical protein BX600DRAFT_510843 [Xylariales sp. PMI_506]|nr:hypothetical protein BX600DRAFT_510843 [Xylariales sp. PMI_506]
MALSSAGPGDVCSSGTAGGDGVLYFAYGSNLSPTQMAQRCPESRVLGLAHLPGWKWLINDRGYANIVQEDNTEGRSRDEGNKRSDGAATVTDPGTGTGTGVGLGTGAADDLVPPSPKNPGVYGLLYHLPPADEALLDGYEGVPWAYEKRMLDVVPVTGVLATGSRDDPLTAVPVVARSALAPHHHHRGAKQEGETAGYPRTSSALTYIDFNRITEYLPRSEYVGRINLGITEASAQWGLPAWYVDTVMRPFIPLSGPTGFEK